MISESIVDEDVWAEAPSDAEEAFLFITLAARAKLSRVIWNTSEARGFSEAEWRKQYIIELITIASELSLEGLPSIPDSVGTSQGMENFDVALARVITRLRARKRELLRADSVLLPVTTKESIRSEIFKIFTLAFRASEFAGYALPVGRYVNTCGANLAYPILEKAWSTWELYWQNKFPAY